MHHFESMPSLHLSNNNDSFPSSPPASPLSFTSTPSIAGKRRGHTHRRSLAISSHLTFPTPSILDQNPAMITPPLSSPALSFPNTASLESLRSGTMLDYDSDLPRTPTVDGDSLRAIPSLEVLPPTDETDEDVILPDTDSDVQMEERETSPGIGHASKLRKVAFNDAIIYYPPRPLSSRQCSFSSQISQPSSRETTPATSSPSLSHRRSLSSLLLPSPSLLPSNTSHRHLRDRKSWTGLITSPFAAARRRRSPNQYRPPTPPLGYDDDRIEVWPQPPAPIIDLDAALGPFQTPTLPLSPSHSAKFWSVTSHVGSHRRSESAPEIRGLGLDAPLTDEMNGFRGLKRKMSVIDEDDRQFRAEEMDVDTDLHEIMIQEGAEMGEMGELVVDTSLRDNNMENKLSKRLSWRKSLREWWRKV
jgi:hypothetical protein